MTETIMPRDTLVAALARAFPDWLIVPAERNIDVPDRPVVIVKQRTIGRLPEAPASHYTVGCVLTLVDDHTDIELAEPELDSNVLDLWESLMSLSNVHPQTATKVSFTETAMAYDIETDLTVQKG